mgnify:CR=1 FL=1
MWQHDSHLPCYCYFLANFMGNVLCNPVAACIQANCDSCAGTQALPLELPHVCFDLHYDCQGLPRPDTPALVCALMSRLAPMGRLSADGMGRGTVLAMT